IRHNSRKIPCKKLYKCTKNFRCSECYKYYSSKSSLNRHIRCSCPSRKNDMKEINNSKEMLIEYKKDNNEKKKDNICMYCNKNFTRKDNLNRHIQYFCKIKKKQDDQKELIFR